VPDVLQLPPPTSVSVITEPAQTLEGPEIAVGSGFTVTGFVRAQPVDKVYEIVAVPDATPSTIPDVPIVAMEPVALVQIPPEEVSVSVIVVPGHTVDGPPITAGNARFCMRP